MKFPFSQRDKARSAAIEAAERYPRACVLPSGGVREFWDFVIGAAIDALDERPVIVTPEDTREFAARLAPYLDKSIPYVEMNEALWEFLRARQLPLFGALSEPTPESFDALDRYRESEAKLVEDARAHRRLREGVEKLRDEIRAELPCTGEYVHIGTLLDEFDRLLDSQVGRESQEAEQ